VDPGTPSALYSLLSLGSTGSGLQYSLYSLGLAAASAVDISECCLSYWLSNSVYAGALLEKGVESSLGVRCRRQAAMTPTMMATIIMMRRIPQPTDI